MGFGNQCIGDRFLFCLLLGADTNFRMVRLKVSSKQADPSLSDGWSYFIENRAYTKYLEEAGEQVQEVRKSVYRHLV